LANFWLCGVLPDQSPLQLAFVLHPLSCFIPSFSGIFQTYVWVGAKGEQFFLSIEPIFKAPPFTPSGVDEQEQPSFIIRVCGLYLRFWPF
jgi:hypothetical protein